VATPRSVVRPSAPERLPVVTSSLDRSLFHRVSHSVIACFGTPHGVYLARQATIGEWGTTKNESDEPHGFRRRQYFRRSFFPDFSVVLDVHSTDLPLDPRSPPVTAFFLGDPCPLLPCVFVVHVDELKGEQTFFSQLISVSRGPEHLPPVSPAGFPCSLRLFSAAVEKTSFGNLKDEDRIFTNLYGVHDPFIKVRIQRSRGGESVVVVVKVSPPSSPESFLFSILIGLGIIRCKSK